MKEKQWEITTAELIDTIIECDKDSYANPDSIVIANFKANKNLLILYLTVIVKLEQWGVIDAKMAMLLMTRYVRKRIGWYIPISLIKKDGENIYD